MTINPTLAQMTDADVLKAISKYGSANTAAAILGIPKTTFKTRAQNIKRYVTQRAPAPEVHTPPKRGVKTFILSSAQNGTEVAEEFLVNLEAYATHLNAEILISGFTYNKSLYENHSKVEADYHPRVLPYMVERQQDIGPSLVFCANMNTLPTAADPLSGFETYTRSKWGVFPHPRVCLKSIPVMQSSKPKQIMTTGSVTLPNYIQKKAGLKAEFHHVVAAVIVEIDSDGDTFCRHLVADKKGNFQDLDVVVVGGKVEDFNRVEAITWGDIHAERLDPDVAEGAWGLTPDLIPMKVDDTMVDFLEPSYQFFHDVLDFRRRNHHNLKDPHFLFEMQVKGTESVKQEIMKVACFLETTNREFATSYVVDSNHDRALTRWLKEADYRKDPVNARFFLDCQAAIYRAIEEGIEGYLPIEAAVRSIGLDLDNVEFLHRTSSFIICPNAGGGIECAMHGDQGANGAKGSVNSFAKMGNKANVADHHGAVIYEGIYQAGHSCLRDMVYNRGGLTSWSPSHIVTYPNGKRTIITMVGKKWRAKR